MAKTAAVKRDDGATTHHVQETFNEKNRTDLGPQDVRYVEKGGAVYAFSMGWGDAEVQFRELTLGGK